jgi:hypothetical protein
MKTKRIAALILAAAIAFLPLIQVDAAFESVGSAASLQWQTTNSVIVSILPSGSKIVCKATIEGKSGTTHIEADLRLYKKTTSGSWSLVQSWLDRSVDGDYLQISESYTPTSGTYKLEVEGEVTRNGTTESVSNDVERTVS